MAAHGEDVTFIRAGVKTDPYSGEPTGLDWDAATETVVSGCGVALGSTGDSFLVGRNAVDVALTLFVPYGTDVTAQDRALVRGVVYEVYGQPFDWRNPLTGTEAGMQVFLRVRSG